MATPRIFPLWPDPSAQNVPTGCNRPRPQLEFYPCTAESAKNGSLPTVVVCPGGGYGMLAEHEGAPVAQLLAAHGFHAFVLYSRVSPHVFPAPYADACRAMRLVRANAVTWGVDPQRIALLGFSAGGHLAATVGTQPNLCVAPEDDLACAVSARPDRLVLCYPVISMCEEHHEGSVLNLLGPEPTAEQRRQFSNDQQVGPTNPPTFLWHTADDGAVPVSNSLRYAAACARLGVPFELHVYPHGPHGVGLATDHPRLADWAQRLLAWLRDW